MASLAHGSFATEYTEFFEGREFYVRSYVQRKYFLERKIYLEAQGMELLSCGSWGQGRVGRVDTDLR